jgi:phosphoserine phosphatase
MQEHMELKDCYAYGDSPGDIAVLQCVGYPQVVNPIRGMARIARSRGWPIVKWM